MFKCKSSYLWLKRLLLMMVAVNSLSGCITDDDDDNETSVDDRGYLHFYNASPNSSTTQLRLDDELVASAPYGDVTPLSAIELNDYVLTLERADTSNASTNIVVIEQNITISKDGYSFLALVGDYTAPELVTYQYEPKSEFDDDQLEFYAYNFTGRDGQLEIYYAQGSGAFETATFLESLSPRGQSSSIELDEGNYSFYVVDVDSGEIILTTAEIPFVETKTYFIVLRDDNETTNGSIVLDQLTTSTFVYSYGNEDSAAQLRVYNSIDALGSVDVLLNGSKGNATFSAVTVDSMSNFERLPYGDYILDLTAVDLPSNTYLQNKIISLASGASKNVVFYESTSGIPSALVFNQNLRQRVYEHDVNFVSFANKLDADGDRYLLKAYFVNEDAGETLETAAQVLTGIGFANVRNFTLVAGDYAVYITYTDDDGVEQSLVKNSYLNLEANTNYVLLLEPDSAAYGGYQLNLVH